MLDGLIQENQAFDGRLDQLLGYRSHQTVAAPAVSCQADRDGRVVNPEALKTIRELHVTNGIRSILNAAYSYRYPFGVSGSTSQPMKNNIVFARPQNTASSEENVDLQIGDVFS